MSVYFRLKHYFILNPIYKKVIINKNTSRKQNFQENVADVYQTLPVSILFLNNLKWRLSYLFSTVLF